MNKKILLYDKPGLYKIKIPGKPKRIVIIIGEVYGLKDETGKIVDIEFKWVCEAGSLSKSDTKFIEEKISNDFKNMLIEINNSK